MPVRRLAAVLLLFSALLSDAAHAESTHITVILVNDIYLMTDQMMADGRKRGGFARLAAAVKAERAKAEATRAHLIFAHAGDTLSPSLMSGIDQGTHIITLTNLIRPDVFVPGNHEFDFGKATFLQRMGEAAFGLYAANLRGADGQPLPEFLDRSMFSADGVRIGLTGATYDDSARASNPGDLRFMPTVATLQEEAQALRREGADFVVAVTHATREQGFALLRSHSIDLILTGHTHDLFVNYDGVGAMAESSYDAHYLIAIDLAIEVKETTAGRRATWWPQFRIIDTATVSPDPEVGATVAGFEQEVDRALDAPIGITAVELDSRVATVRGREAAIGDLIADALRAENHADAAMVNGGSIRAGRIYAPGATITRRDILGELPFGNRAVTLELSGGDLHRALENGFSQLPNPSGRFPQVSGLAIEVDPTRPPGNRITSIRINGALLEESRSYRVATNDFMARGGDGYDVLRAAKPLLPIADSPSVSEQVIEYVSGLKAIHSAVQGRIVIY